MEPAGLAVGVIGLFGLFNTCLDVANKYDEWKDFGSESRCLTAQFEAQKLRLQKWGEAVGVEDESVSKALGFVREKWETTQGLRAARGDVLSLLEAIVSAIPGCTFIMAGLDERDLAKDFWPGNSDDSIASFLGTLRRATAGTSTRIMIISRDEPEIRRGLSNENP
ncbi:ankyrin [Aspergillus arachidicola]|uniref:Ankyrin n=1 Tax=Aspergillus arachidicola TaxID=656916 RepID=A0A2G7GA77_9EURO|nr:ankyrin [Aspergillus arachidicola]